MNSRKIEILVGLFVLVGLAAVTYLTLRIGGGRVSKTDTYSLNARFTNASGLKAGSSVRVAGVTIGNVSSVTLNFEDMVALVTFRVPKALKLDDDTIASIKSSGLIGEKFISLKAGASGSPLKADSTIIDTESSVDLEDIISRFAFGSVDKK